MRQSSRGFVAKNWEKIEIYSFAAKFAAKIYRKFGPVSESCGKTLNPKP